MRKISEAQREAARRNGAKSRGPVTAHGKAIASRNNLRHGFRSNSTDPAATPNPAACERRFARLSAYQPPESAAEEALLREIATLTERIARLNRMESHCLNEMLRNRESLRSADGRAFAGIAILGNDEIRTSRRLVRAIAELGEIRRAQKFFCVRTPQPAENKDGAPIASLADGRKGD